MFGAESKRKFEDYKNYGIIAAASLFAIFFLPMLGSTAGLGWNLPNTFVGWIVWTITKIMVAVLNIVLFHSFMEQAKVNVKDNPYYIEANIILMRYGKMSARDPRDPESWEREEYKTKGITIAITTVISAIGLTQAVLTFNWLDMLSYMFTVALGIMFGILQMDKAETYWTTEYWQYAKKIERSFKKNKESDLAQGDDPAGDLGGTRVLESYVYDAHNGTYMAANVDSSGGGICGVGVGASGNTDADRVNSYVQKNIEEVKQ